MFHIVDAHAERMVADIETADNFFRVFEVHGVFRPEIAVQQVHGPCVQRVVELMQVKLLQQVHKAFVIAQSRDHSFRGHHQFE